MTGYPQKEHKRGFGFYFGRILTALLGLLIGAGIFFWNALGAMDYVNIKPVATNSTEGLDQYISAQKPAGKKLGEVALYVDPDYPIRAVPQKDPDIENFLVFGIDSRGGDEASRADSIIIVTVDRKHHMVKLTSILRDTQVHMNDMDGSLDKVNASYAYGGVGMLINTLNSNFDLDISKFVMFDFWSSVAFVDALGGVELDITQDEIEATNSVLREMAWVMNRNPAGEELTHPGLQRLDGLQAIAWARVRYIDSDFGRTSRQRILMETILKEFAKRNVLQQASFAVKVLGELETNISRGDLIATGLSSALALKSIRQYHVPQDGMYETDEDTWNMIIDRDQQIPALHDFIWGVAAGDK